MAIGVAAPRPPEPDARAAGRVAVLDVGSNTVRLIVYRAPPGGQPRIELARKEAPRLGEGVGHGGRLRPEAVERGLATLRRFARGLAAAGGVPTVAVATSAVRDAADGAAFVAKVRAATGLDLRVLSGEEEGRYAYLGVASAWALDDDLVVDLGGGSLQLATVHRGALRAATSLPLGALRLTEEFFAHDPPKEREVAELRTHVREFLADRLPPAPERRAAGIHGVGGTIRALARIAIALRAYPLPRVHGYALTRRDLDGLADLLAGLPADRRREVPGVSGDRADVVVAGLFTVLELLRATGHDALRVSGRGIRDGLAAEALGIALPATADELLDRSARTAAQQFGIDPAAPAALARRAGVLFDAVAGRAGWGPVERRALRAAALFHDAGLAVDVWGHGRHAAYLLENLPVVGLDHSELLLATLGLAQHDGDEPLGRPKTLRAVLDKDGWKAARALGAVLLAAETLADDGLKVQLGSGPTLRLAVSPAATRDRSPRAVARLRKPLKRALEMEVELRGPGE